MLLIKGMTYIGSIDVMFSMFAKRVFPIGEEGSIAFGLLLGAHGLGAILGPLIANRLGDGSEHFLRRGIAAGFLLAPLSWAMIGASPVLALALLGSVLRGIGGSINWTYSTVLLQTKVPDHFLGRIFGLDFTVFTLFMSVSLWLTGMAFDTFDIDPRQMAMYIAGISVIPLLLWLLTLREQRKPAPETV